MAMYSIMMLVGGIVLVVFGLVTLLNFISMFGSMKDRGFEGMKGKIAIHVLAPFASGIGGLSLLGGFIWFLIDKYAK